MPRADCIAVDKCMSTDFVNVSPTASYGYMFDESDRRARTNTGDVSSDGETEPVDVHDRPPLGKEFNSAKSYVLSLQFNVLLIMKLNVIREVYGNIMIL